ncbi:MULTISPECIES: hypothetical protein [unclassified Beijerinckia]|uniref:hypothetical protein n=1 Tax=unclassified Beijerinckia TaxID=2638183 RepID=UPI00089D2927|nr:MULTISPECIES: hypothetical protein [unclassified Beijerinckia]MDH7796457.1 hypothetical protein [Beijerinckia sp. GAS462]SEC45910.1 hypothetical protein SAMN05443249_2739 [Beijerinckia sp. 28-YEA-48]
MMFCPTLHALNDPLLLTKEMFDLQIPDLAFACSRINRYAGRGKFALSIAQHQTLLSWYVPQELAMAALTHDLAETFISDIPASAKSKFPEIELYELRILGHLANLLGVPWDHYRQIHGYDIAIRNDEMLALGLMYELRHPMLDCIVDPMHPDDAAQAWMTRFYQLRSE